MRCGVLLLVMTCLAGCASDDVRRKADNFEIYSLWDGVVETDATATGDKSVFTMSEEERASLNTHIVRVELPLGAKPCPKGWFVSLRGYRTILADATDVMLASTITEAKIVRCKTTRWPARKWEDMSAEIT